MIKSKICVFPESSTETWHGDILTQISNAKKKIYSNLQKNTGCRARFKYTLSIDITLLIYEKVFNTISLESISPFNIAIETFHVIPNVLTKKF